MRNQIFKFAIAAFVSSNALAAIERADSKTYDDKEQGMSIIETGLRDYIYPFDGLWPWLKVGLNYQIKGRLEGTQISEVESELNHDFEDLVDSYELAPLDLYYDIKIWATKDKISVKYYRDAEMKILATHLVAELEFPSIVTKTYSDLEMKNFECTFEVLEPSHIPLINFINLLWTPVNPPAMWYMGEVCMDEENQNMLSYLSDDMTGIEYVIFFDKETKKAKKAVSGITN